MKTLSTGDLLTIGKEEYSVIQVYNKSLSGNTYKVKNKRTGIFLVIKEFISDQVKGYRDPKTNRIRCATTDATNRCAQLCQKEITFQRLVLAENDTNNRYVFPMDEHIDYDEHGKPFAPLLSVYTEKGDVLSEYCRKARDQRNVKEILKIMKAICHAVNSLHQKDILHLDLKPDNLFLEQDVDTCVVKILDLGSAQKINEFNYQLFSLSSGTIAFRSPNIGMLSNAYTEMQRNRIISKLSFYDDVYSIANIFIFLLLGKTYSEIKSRIPRKGERESEKFKDDLLELGPKELEWCYSFINQMFEKLKNKEYTCVIAKNSAEIPFSFYSDVCTLSEIVEGQGYYPESIRQNGNAFMKRYIANRKIRIDSKMIPDIEPRV